MDWHFGINPLVPDAHYSERQDEAFSLQIQRLEVDLKLNCEFGLKCVEYSISIILSF